MKKLLLIALLFVGQQIIACGPFCTKRCQEQGKKCISDKFKFGSLTNCECEK